MGIFVEGFYPTFNSSYHLKTSFYMKLLTGFLAVSLIVLGSLTASAQRIKTTSGDENILKNESTVNIEFIYDCLSVGKYDKEADYLKAKTEEESERTRKGDSWAKSWVSDRESRFERYQRVPGCNGHDR